MNILFVYSSPIIPEGGGVQRVTKVLAALFEDHGHKTFFLSRYGVDNMDIRQYVLPENDNCNNKNNKDYLNSLIYKLKIDIIINQDGLNKDVSRLVLSCKTGGVRLISVAHNSIIGAVRHFRYSRLYLFKKIHLAWILPVFDLKPVNHFLVWLFKQTHKAFFREIVFKSDRYVLLSERYIDELEYVLGEECKSKVSSISNPCTIARRDNNIIQKEKVVLYVGRIDFAQKRNDLLLHVWSKVREQISGWKLIFVGNGPDYEKLKMMGRKMGLDDVEYVGQTSPIEYYQKASVLCLTSAFEGLPLTIVEAMSYGVVPMAFDSFASLRSLIDDKVTGYVIPPFDLDEYSNKLSSLMSDSKDREFFSSKATIKFKDYELCAIGGKWLGLFGEICNEA